MKKLSALLILGCLPLVSFASWQIAGNPTTVSGQKADKIVSGTPKFLQANPKYNLHVSQGYLIYSIRPYAQQHHWKLKWHASRTTTNNTSADFAGPSFKSVINNVLANYPNLKASFVKRGHILVIQDAHTQEALG
jgi:hypothetical protein